jgi:acetylglutamate kinase
VVSDSGEAVEVDFGHVGDIERADPRVLQVLLDARYVPVVASLAGDDAGNVYNVNADTVAEAIAVALRAQKLIFLTGAPGVLRDRSDPSTLVAFADPDDLAELLSSGGLTGGMRPKVEACIRAATAGVERTHIIDGRVPDALLLEVFTGAGCGTMIVGRKEKAAYLDGDLAAEAERASPRELAEPNRAAAAAAGEER